MGQPSKKETTGTVEPAASETNEPATILTPLPAVLTANEAAALLDVDRKRIYRLVAKGVLPGMKVGRSLRFERDVILALRNADVQRRSAAPGVPTSVACPFCSSPAYSYGIADDGFVGYGCRSGKCVSYQYQCAFGVQWEGQPAELEQAMNVGRFIAVRILNYGNRARVITHAYDGVRSVEYNRRVTLFEAIAGCGGAHEEPSFRGMRG